MSIEDAFKMRTKLTDAELREAIQAATKAKQETIARLLRNELSDRQELRNPSSVFTHGTGGGTRVVRSGKEMS